MSFDACEKLVKAGDHDRWLSAQSAPPESRRALMAIYATNLLIARAPWASPDPLVAQMRLQWWADEIGKIYHGEQVVTHEIFPALREVIFDHTLPRALFEALIEARHADLSKAPFENGTAFDSYIEGTSGSVMALAALALGAKPTHLQAVKNLAYACGVAALLRASPALIARGHAPLPEDIQAVIQAAKTHLKNARAQKLPSALTPALLAAWRADATLAHASKHPAHILSGQLEESPARKMASLRWKRLTKRW